MCIVVLLGSHKTQLYVKHLLIPQKTISNNFNVSVGLFQEIEMKGEITKKELEIENLRTRVETLLDDEEREKRLSSCSDCKFEKDNSFVSKYLPNMNMIRDWLPKTKVINEYDLFFRNQISIVNSLLFSWHI